MKWCWFNFFNSTFFNFILRKSIYLSEIKIFILGILFNWGYLHSQTKVHIALPGDDIYRLARKYNLRAKQIAHVNNFEKINRPFRLFEAIIIPEKYYQVSTSNDSYLKEKKHTVLENETLFDIARKYDLTVYDLHTLNPTLKSGRPLEKGMELKITAGSVRKSQPSRQWIILNSKEVAKRKDIRITTNNEIIYNDQSEDNRKKSEYALKLILDTLSLPEWDKTPSSYFIHKIITNFNDGEYNIEIDLDSLNDLLFYCNSSLLNPNSKKSDVIFKKNALSLIDKMLKSYPNNSMLFSFAAMVYFWIGHYPKSIYLAQEANQIKENYFASATIAGISAMKSEWENTVTHFNQLEQKTPRNTVFYNLGNAYFNLLEPQKAIDYFLKISNNIQILPEINYKIGKSYLILGNKEEGCKYLKKSKSMNYRFGTIDYDRNCRLKK